MLKLKAIKIILEITITMKSKASWKKYLFKKNLNNHKL